MRPDRSFRFEDFGDGKGKKLVVEFDAAAGVDAYKTADGGAAAWPEIDINTSPNPTGDKDGFFSTLYGYDSFHGHYSFGCRLEPMRSVICALYNPTHTQSGTGDPDAENGRIFENQAGMGGSTVEFGGGPWASNIDPESGVSLDKPWRVCQNTDPDTNCRDRFRLELTKNSYAMYVNGVKYYEAKNIPAAKQFPDAMVNGEVYVYFASWGGRVPAETTRFHWDRIAVNPKDAQGRLLPPSKPADVCFDQPNSTCAVGGPAPTVMPSVTPTATPRPSATSVPTPVNSATPRPTVQPTVVPTATPTIPPVFGKASILFNGSGALRVPHAAELNTTGNWTIETWFKDESTDSYDRGLNNFNHPERYLLVKGGTDSNSESPYLLSIGYHNVYFGARTGWQNRTLAYNLTNAKVSKDGWHHLAVTFNASNRTASLYIDGLKVSEGTLPAYSKTGNTGQIFIGRNNNQLGWRGKLDNVRIWNVVRSATQIRDNYEKDLPNDTNGLVGNWMLNEGTGTVANDHAGTAQNGAFAGGVSWTTESHPTSGN